LGLTKSEIFNHRQNRIAGMMKALAHPARIAILQQIIKEDRCICGDLVEELGLAQATISQHLKELKEAGLIRGNIDGASVCYCIDEKTWKLYKKEMKNFFTEFRPPESCD